MNKNTYDKVTLSLENKSNNNNFINIIIEGISGVFLPYVNILSAAGILKGLLTVLAVTKILENTSDTYLVMNAVSDSVFYFFPILLAFTSAKSFGANGYMGAVIGGILVYPTLTQAFSVGDSIDFLGVPINAVHYPSSVIPIIMAVGLLKYVQILFDRVIPDVIKSFMVPLLCIVVVSGVTLFIFGPLGTIIGNSLADGYGYVYNWMPLIAGLFLGASIQIMVIFGFHWSFVLVAINNITITGYDTILALIAPAVFAQAGAALAVFFKSKDKEFKTMCLSAVLSAMFGVTEPAMFGVNLPLKKPMTAVCISGAIGGAIVGFSGARATSFAFPGIMTMPVFLGEGFYGMVLGCLAGFVMAFLITSIFVKKTNLK